MTENIGSPNGAASGSTPNECNAAKTETASKLDLQHELDRRQEEAPSLPTRLAVLGSCVSR